MSILTQSQPTINTAYRAAYLELRRRWPNVDFDILSDAAMQMAADAQAVADEAGAKPGIGHDEPDPEFVLEARLDFALARTQEHLDAANQVLEALGSYYE